MGWVIGSLVMALLAMLFFLGLDRHQDVRGQSFTRDTHWLVWVAVFLTTPLVWALQVFGLMAERPRARGTDYGRASKWR